MKLICKFLFKICCILEKASKNADIDKRDSEKLNELKEYFGKIESEDK